MDVERPSSDRPAQAATTAGRWDVDAAYTVPVGPDMALDGALARVRSSMHRWRS